MVVVISLLATMVAVGAEEPVSSKDKYKEQIYSALELTEFEKSKVEYKYLFEYNADNSPTSDEAIPDYVVTRIDEVNTSQSTDTIKLGAYYLPNISWEVVDKAGYYIYSTVTESVT